MYYYLHICLYVCMYYCIFLCMYYSMQSNVHAPKYNVDALERGCTTTTVNPNLENPIVMLNGVQRACT